MLERGNAHDNPSPVIQKREHKPLGLMEVELRIMYHALDPETYAGLSENPCGTIRKPMRVYALDQKTYAGLCIRSGNLCGPMRTLGYDEKKRN